MMVQGFILGKEATSAGQIVSTVLLSAGGVLITIFNQDPVEI